VLSVLLLLAIVLSVLLFAIVLSVLLLLAIVLSVLLRYTDSDYPFGVFKLFFIQTLDLTQHSFYFSKSQDNSYFLLRFL
jgi:hypothetical protein